VLGGDRGTRPLHFEQPDREITLRHRAGAVAKLTQARLSDMALYPSDGNRTWPCISPTENAPVCVKAGVPMLPFAAEPYLGEENSLVSSVFPPPTETSNEFVCHPIRTAGDAPWRYFAPRSDDVGR
jgi:hypothetical protein